MPIRRKNLQTETETSKGVKSQPNALQADRPATLTDNESPGARIRRRPPIQSPPEQVQHSEKAVDYVGYKHPPKHTQFKKGRSGNPKGRPKGAQGTKTIVRKLMTGKVEVRTSAGIVRMTRMEAALHKFMELALKGNPRALIQLIALYSQAVPDEETARPPTGSEELTPADEAIIAAFKASIQEDQGDE